jgi:hypothetical protein
MRLHSDAEFNRVLLRAFSDVNSGGVDPAALAGAGEQVKPGDLVGWERYWRREGDRAIGRADTMLAMDDISGAGRRLLCATTAYGLAATFDRSDPQNESSQQNRASQVSAFRAAMPLLPIDSETLDIDSPGKPLHGYLIHSSAPTAPTALIPMGQGAGAEDGYTRYAAAAAEANVNCVVLEFPSGDDVAVLAAVLEWAQHRSPSPLSVVCLDEMVVRAAASARRHSQLAGVVCCPQNDLTAGAVGAMIHEYLCPVVVLPAGSAVAESLRWVRHTEWA